MNIYVGNLSREVTQEDLKELFETKGEVTSANVIMDRFTGEPRGFAFIEMPTKAEALTAINDLNGMDLKGRAIKVNAARDREEKRRGDFGRRRGY